MDEKSPDGIDQYPHGRSRPFLALDSFWVPVEFASTFYGNVKVEQFRHLYCAANLRDFGYTVLTDTQVSWKRVGFGLR